MGNGAAMPTFTIISGKKSWFIGYLETRPICSSRECQVQGGYENQCLLWHRRERVLVHFSPTRLWETPETFSRNLSLWQLPSIIYCGDYVWQCKFLWRMLFFRWVIYELSENKRKVLEQKDFFRHLWTSTSVSTRDSKCLLFEIIDIERFLVSQCEII